ncbi:MAG: DUF4157 domain-containing protein [Methylococcaceae bacterium]|nr:DUF4157 domain-containing protein [Methylococcaceae bacterium]
MEIGQTVENLLAQSHGQDGRLFLSHDTSRWIADLEPQLPGQFWVHDDVAARRAARALSVPAFTCGNRIFLGDHSDHDLQLILRHELVHLAQVQLGLVTSEYAAEELLELEACSIGSLPIARAVRYCAHRLRAYPFVWFVAIGAGLYVLLRPGVANAPGPKDKTFPSPSIGQIVAEALCIFVVPGGAMSLGGRLGLGFLGRTALAGSVTNVSLRAVDDVSHNQASSPLMYLFDASTGAIIGFVVPGGIRLIGKVGSYGFDRLATYGLTESDIRLTSILAEQAAKAPLNAVEAQKILMTRGLGGRVSQWWLNRRGVIVLYRGQEVATDRILSPLARTDGVAASEALVAQLRSIGLEYSEIAGFTARYHNQPIPPSSAPPGLGLQPLGAAGIPTSRIPGIAANFGASADDAVVYVIRVPRVIAIEPQGWQGLHLENEFIILDQVPPGGVVNVIPANKIAPLVVDQYGLLTPGR